MKLTHEIVEKIKSVGSADEVLAIAKECNVEITPEEANKYFHQLHLGELDDDDLDAVADGACADSNANENPAVSLGDTVQITSEAACPDCGGKIGTVSKKHSRGYCIKCKECKKQICDLGDCTYVVIG